MKYLVALLALAFALVNLYAGYLLASSGYQLVNKAIDQRLMMSTGGAAIILFAAILAYQSVRLVVSR